jgi:hypothetical protein
LADIHACRALPYFEQLYDNITSFGKSKQFYESNKYRAGIFSAGRGANVDYNFDD